MLHGDGGVYIFAILDTDKCVYLGSVEGDAVLYTFCVGFESAPEWVQTVR